jgi:hypothetical protein
LEVNVLIINILTLIVLAITAYFIILYWRETKNLVDATKKAVEVSNQTLEVSNKALEISNKNLYYSNFPIISFVPGPPGPETQGIMYIKNKGKGAAFNVTAAKIPLPDNSQARLVAPSSRGINNPHNKSYAVIGPDETLFFFREDDYTGKRIHIQVMFRDMFNRGFMWRFEGGQNTLETKEWMIDPRPQPSSAPLPDQNSPV